MNRILEKAQLRLVRKMQLTRIISLLSLLVSAIVPTNSFAEGDKQLRLKNGSFSTGSILPGGDASELIWQADGFRQPLHVDLNAVRSISAIDADEDLPTPEGQLFETKNGGMIVGKLVKISPNVITVDTPAMGQVDLRRDNIRAMVSSAYAGKVIHSGPTQDGLWTNARNEDDWVFEGGAFVSKKAGGTIVGDVSMPEKARVSMTLSWTEGSPDFVIAIGTERTASNTRAEDVSSAARLEVWDREFALVRETDSDADIRILDKLELSDKRLQITFYVDQVEGRVIAFDQHGRLLDSIQVKEKGASRTRPAIHISNIGALLQLERVEVREWDGFTTSSSDDKPAVLTGEGEIAAGISGYDAESGELLLAGEDGEQRLELKQMLRGLFAPPTGDPSGNKTEPKEATSSSDSSDSESESDTESKEIKESSGADADDNADSRDTGESPSTESEAAEEASDSDSDSQVASTADETDNTEEPLPTVELLLQDRTRLNGNWLGGSGDTLAFSSPSITQIVHFKASEVLGMIGSDERYSPKTQPAAQGTLKLDKSQLIGSLAPTPDGTEASADSTGLFWHVIGTSGPSELLPSASGGIVYRKAAVQAAVQQAKAQPNVQLRGIGRFLSRPGQRRPSDAGKKNSPEMSFRTGDIIFGVVEKIDEKGIYFESEQSTTKFAPHDRVQSVDLSTIATPITSDEKKLQRLMTVPRSMKLDPPTHLLISKTGDPLRVRLNRMTAEFLEVEVKQEIVNIPRENVAKVIWLHDRQWESEETAKESEKQENDEGQIAEIAAEERAEDVATSNVPFRIHAIRRGDRGLTFVPSGCDGKMLAGASDLLGECNVEIEEVDQLLFGRDITARVREYREDPWVLALAQYPRVFLEDEGGAADPSAGKNSEFVGKFAPKFGLAQLDGEHFRLTDHRDRIVVLDFWASWCGPCMQTMPKVDEIVEEIGTDKVHLVAVNLQEPAARVEAALAKLNIAPTVLLDVDGEVAAAYGASAIPQTVIIDKQGVVQHLFVGGGNRFVTNFRVALEELTAETNVAQ